MFHFLKNDMKTHSALVARVVYYHILVQNSNSNFYSPIFTLVARITHVHVHVHLEVQVCLHSGKPNVFNTFHSQAF